MVVSGEDVLSDSKIKLKIQTLRKTYGDVVALDNVSMEMRDGEFLTLLGPSGSGKSTLLWAVAGLNDPDGGEVWIDGKEATHTPPPERDIGMVFQNYALFPHMTVAENISFPLEMRKVPAAARAAAVNEALGMVKLPGVSSRYPKQLSGGQQQRIALARALVYNPSIVLMDEPLGALDKKLRDHLQLEIKHIHEKLGTTVLYVTHDQEEAMVMSDRICLMNAGRIEQIGSPEELYFHPTNVFVADFLGESNMIEGRVLTTSSGTATIEIPNVGKVTTPCNKSYPAGAEIIHMTRPESIDLLTPDERRSNEATGLAKEVIMSGTVTKVFVDIGDGRIIQVTQLTQATKGHFVGEKVRLGWNETSGVILTKCSTEK